MSLVTRCPYCDTSFRVTEDQLSAASGAVRCGACLAVFSAPEHIVETRAGEDGVAVSPEAVDDRAVDATEEPGGPDWAPAEAEPRDARTVVSVDDDEWSEAANGAELATVDEQVSVSGDGVDDLAQADADTQAEAEDGEIVAEPDADALDDLDGFGELDTEADPGSVSGAEDVTGEEREEEPLADSASAPDEAPVETEFPEESIDAEVFSGEIDVETSPDELIGDYAPTPPRHTLAWTLGALVLAGVLVVQLAWFNRDILAQNPALRGYYESACGLIGCNLPVYSDSSSLHVTHLVVRTHPKVANALAVDAIIRNDAPWRQYFPDLRLTFSDLHGALIAARTFKPSEYLAGEMTGVKLIPAKTEVRISLEIVDPGPDATNYALTVDH